MRFTLPIVRRLADALRKRDWFGIGFELLVVVVGVLLGVEASRWSAEREERIYRDQIFAALDGTLKVYVEEGGAIDRHVAGIFDEYRSRVAAGQRPPPPYWHLDQLERPPTLAWDAMVATGIARSVKPDMVFRVARFFSRGDGLGDRYQRYNAFTETHVLPYLDDPTHFYGPDGKLAPTYAAHVVRLREIMAVNNRLTEEAGEIRSALKAGNSGD